MALPQPARSDTTYHYPYVAAGGVAGAASGQADSWWTGTGCF